MRKLLLIIVLAPLLLVLSGCFLAGLVANALPSNEPPKYAGLAGQTTGVMVWADRALRIDYPSVQLDIAGAVHSKLRAMQQGSEPTELKGTTFPVGPASIARYQDDHPELEAEPMTEVATRLGVSRLIYIELERLTTRPHPSLELYRGSAVATVKVIAVNGTEGKVVYQENNVSAVFPRLSPADGLPSGNDYTYYLGTIDAFSTAVVNRFVTHEAPR